MPSSRIDYESLAQDAMRGVVRKVLQQVAKSGLPGEHHFYISFTTDAPGVLLSKRLREKYPREMTIVLQHRFSGLQVHDDGFEVTLSFDSIPERLAIPFSALKVFFDPSVPFGHQFEAPGADEAREHGEARRDHESEAGRRPGASWPTASQPSAPAAPTTSGGMPAARQRPHVVTSGPGAKPAVKADTQPAPEPAESGAAKVVELDAFRKK
jgi:hypothetical protein